MYAQKNLCRPSGSFPVTRATTQPAIAQKNTATVHTTNQRACGITSSSRKKTVSAAAAEVVADDEADRMVRAREHS